MNEAGKTEAHKACLCLGSNIQPETHLRKGIQLLRKHAEVTAHSTAWETRAVGSTDNPNYLNACVSLVTDLAPDRLIEEVIRPIEARLGRIRTEDKNAPRVIDIDLVLYDERPLRLEYWEEAFMLVPLAELIPEFIHPFHGQKLAEIAQEACKRTWILPHPEVLNDL